jgi:predicted phosphate transport protein (TIGR00153 family)
LPISDVFSFLGSGEKKTLERVEGMLDMAIESGNHLNSLVELLKEFNFEAEAREFNEITDLVKRSHDEHRSLVHVICTGSFFGGIREDLLALLESIDDITYASKHAAAIFHEAELPKDVMDYFFQDNVASFISTCVEAAQLLKNAVQALEKDKNVVLATVEKVEAKEEEADELHHSIVKHLYKNEINAKSLDIILLKDFLTIADDIADNSERGSDVLLILVAKGYS